MKISELVTELQQARKMHGDVEVTVTHAFMPDGWSRVDNPNLPDVIETTCENVIFHDNPVGGLTKRVRLYL